MRVCLISREYPPETGFGGIATFTKHLAHGLASLGHDVEVVSLAKEKASSYSEAVVENGVETGQHLKIHRVVQHEFPSKLNCINMAMPYSRYLLCTSTALWQKFSELNAIKPFDAVDTPELLAEGIYPALTREVPLTIRLYTPHSKFISEKLHNVSASFDHLFVASVERVAMLSADVLTSPSDDLADFVAHDLGIERDSIAIVRNPINTSIFTPDGPTALPALPAGKLRVLFVGRLEERKGINYLVEAIPQVVKACPQAEFVIIGDDTMTAEGQTSVLVKLKESLRQSGAEKHVTFIDRVKLDELPAYYRSADVSIVPSVYDNSPYTCLEAMACGRAVIGTSAGGTKEYMEHDISGLIIPAKDPGAITDALIKLLSDQSERERLTKGARLRAVDKFDRKEIARQTVALYERAARHYAEQKARGEAKHLYHHPYQRATEDATILLESMDKMFYDLMYQTSYRFRMSHWWHFFKARPKLFAAKLFSKVSRTALRLTGTKDNRMPDALLRLESSIAVKEKERAQ